MKKVYPPSKTFSWTKDGRTHTLRYGGRIVATCIPDEVYPEMYRTVWADDPFSQSHMMNLTRAKAAARTYAITTW
jgi:hypothetical protein